ncbi:MAG: IS6 family transposase [Gammaproteobacteria bacterium]|nr:IS6 family transposase [Gammaproteobacteria bacterium]MBT3870786.1 IS6 family transposase [Gammaproteobacteria bacterium]MBT4378388.1 IS6 family transposase [Gammaproteobacteria bacterium]MBT4617787.1 IS6 family transposase [Gammaproteobacteria bacterium]MBT5199910.1 IS6 family transposase [Gammaproteobacteria bacterium]
MYKRYRFPPEIIQHAVWLYFRFNLSHRDIEDLLAQRGVIVTRQSIRLWCNKFGSKYAARLHKRHQGYGDTFFIDEIFIKIGGKQHYLWRAVDQDGEVVDVFLQKKRDGQAAKRFFKRILKKKKGDPRKIVTDKLRSYGAAHRKLIAETIHSTEKYANNRAELSHQPTRVRERSIRKFKFMKQTQRFLSTHAAVYNFFNLGRHLVSAETYRLFRLCSLASWKNAVMI